MPPANPRKEDLTRDEAHMRSRVKSRCRRPPVRIYSTLNVARIDRRVLGGDGRRRRRDALPPALPLLRHHRF